MGVRPGWDVRGESEYPDHVQVVRDGSLPWKETPLEYPRSLGSPFRSSSVEESPSYCDPPCYCPSTYRAGVGGSSGELFVKDDPGRTMRVLVGRWTHQTVQVHREGQDVGVEDITNPFIR